MNVLIVFATVEGQTGKIAEFVEKDVKKHGHTISRINADEVSVADLDGVDAVILAAPVHQRRHPRVFEAAVTSLKPGLATRKTLLLSVSLNAAFPEGHAEASEYVTEMNMRTGFSPDDTMLVPGAVRTENYDYFAMQVIRHVVMRNRDFDPDAGTHEFTDWQELSSGVSDFLKHDQS